jgi:hypothetical protein
VQLDLAVFSKLAVEPFSQENGRGLLREFPVLELQTQEGGNGATNSTECSLCNAKGGARPFKSFREVEPRMCCKITSDGAPSLGKRVRIARGNHATGATVDSRSTWTWRRTLRDGERIFFFSAVAPLASKFWRILKTK